MTGVAAAPRPRPIGPRPQQFRFGAVFAVVRTVALFEVLAPSHGRAPLSYGGQSQ
jgi:hypothetical protein